MSSLKYFMWLLVLVDQSGHTTLILASLRTQHWKLPFNLGQCPSRLKKERKEHKMNGLGSSWLSPGQSLLFAWKPLHVGQEFSKATTRLLAPTKDLFPEERAKACGIPQGAPLWLGARDGQMRIWPAWPDLNCTSILKEQETFLTRHWVRSVGNELSSGPIVYNLMAQDSETAPPEPEWSWNKTKLTGLEWMGEEEV